MHESRHISATEMRAMLRDAYAQDREKSLPGQVARQLRDPAMPGDLNNRTRIHPVWLTLGLMIGFVTAVFVYFSFLRT